MLFINNCIFLFLKMIKDTKDDISVIENTKYTFINLKAVKIGNKINLNSLANIYNELIKTKINKYKF